MNQLRQYLPTVFRGTETLKGLLASDLVALAAISFLYVGAIVFPWLVFMYFGLTQVFGMSLVTLLHVWASTAIAVAGAWSSLGRGLWHWRFLAAAWVGLCILAAFMGVCTSPLVRLHAGFEKFPFQAVAVFGGAAFGAQWIASVGQVQLARLYRPPASARLRSGQFNIASLLIVIAIVAAALGAIRLIREMLPTLRESQVIYIDDGRWAFVAAIVVFTLIALPCMLLSWRTMAISLPVLLLVLGFGAYLEDFSTLRRSPSDFVRSVAFLFQEEATVLFAAAIVQLFCLRLCGFRLLRINDQSEANLART